MAVSNAFSAKTATATDPGSAREPSMTCGSITNVILIRNLLTMSSTAQYAPPEPQMTRSIPPMLVRSASVAFLGWTGIGYGTPNPRSVRPTA